MSCGRSRRFLSLDTALPCPLGTLLRATVRQILCATSRNSAQACEALYRWDSSFPLGKPLEKLSAGTVVHKLRSYARIHSLYDHTTFCSAVTSVSFCPQTDRWAPFWRSCRMQSPS